MIGLAISILWFALGVIILAAIIYVALWGIKSVGVPVPPRVEQLVWVVFLILVLIYLLMAIQGGGRMPFRFSGLADRSIAAYSSTHAGYLQGMLT